ncbi:MAG: hypothetical protein WD904_08085 [Dehalococcoidia bacterium]
MTIALRRPFVLAGIAIVVSAWAMFSLGSPRQAAAHPLGNFTINRYSRIELYSDVIRINYVLDIAEIPAFQEMDGIDTDGDGTVSPAESNTYVDRATQEIADALTLLFDGEEQTLQPIARRVTFPEGQGGLDTIRIDAAFETPTPAGQTAIEFRDADYADRLGWKEIVVAPLPGLVLQGSPPTDDVSAELTTYPDSLLSSPLNTTNVSFSADATGAAAAPAPVLPASVTSAVSRQGAGFASLIDADNLTLSVVLLALLAAFGFGAVHALEPGHGKTLVAAYFVGVQGSARQALMLGLVIAATHTIGVLTIGSIAIFASHWVLPEALYPWLRLASGMMVLALGVRLVTMRGGGRFLHKLTHLLPWRHHHHHDHDEPPAQTGVSPWRSLIALGLADGLTPSPSALIVLLAAVSLGRIGLGIALIVAFSVGLSAVLAGISLGLLYARQVIDRVRAHPLVARVPLAASLTGESAIVRVLPLTGAVVLVGVGAVLTLRALPGLSL